VKPGDIATGYLKHVVLASDDVVFAAGSVATAAYYISDGQCHYVSWSMWVDEWNINEIHMRYNRILRMGYQLYIYMNERLAGYNVDTTIALGLDGVLLVIFNGL